MVEVVEGKDLEALTDGELNVFFLLVSLTSGKTTGGGCSVLSDLGKVLALRSQLVRGSDDSEECGSGDASFHR